MQSSSDSMVERMIGAARLDVHTYEAIERDTGATTSALLVVVIAAIASGIGALNQGIGGLIGEILAAIIGWVLYSVVAYFVGTTIFKSGQTNATLGEVLRTLGFAQSPRILLILAFIPVLGWAIAVAVFFWILATTVVAIRHALELTTGTAIGTAVVAWIVYIIPYGIIRWILT